MRAKAKRREADPAKSASADHAFSNETSTSASSSFIPPPPAENSHASLVGALWRVRRRQNPASVIPVTLAARVVALRKLAG
jgi:hypothetical protein